MSSVAHRIKALGLYRYTLRIIRRLPPGTPPLTYCIHVVGSQEYYRDHAKIHWHSHVGETDPERMEMLLKRAKTDADWILKKVSGTQYSQLMSCSTFQKNRYCTDCCLIDYFSSINVLIVVRVIQHSTTQQLFFFFSGTPMQTQLSLFLLLLVLSEAAVVHKDTSTLPDNYILLAAFSSRGHYNPLSVLAQVRLIPESFS